MIYKVYGAVLLLLGFGGIGFLMNHKRRKELSMLQQMNCFLDNLICDLRYCQAPLCQLINRGERHLSGELQQLIKRFTAELDAQIAPDAFCCMAAVMSSCVNLPASVGNILTALGQSFGRYDVEGQVRCLEAVQHRCRHDALYLEDRLGSYTRCCQAYTLGAGAILALILL